MRPKGASRVSFVLIYDDTRRKNRRMVKIVPNNALSGVETEDNYDRSIDQRAGRESENERWAKVEPDEASSSNSNEWTLYRGNPDAKLLLQPTVLKALSATKRATSRKRERSEFEFLFETKPAPVPVPGHQL